MSKKSDKGKKSKKHENIEEVDAIEMSISEGYVSAAVEIGYLTNAILDYYSEIAEQPLDDGDEWKEGTEYAPKAKSIVPKELDDEIKKAFLAQVKKFQK